MVERLLSMHEVVGSIPTFSTLFVAGTHPSLALGLSSLAAIIVAIIA